MSRINVLTTQNFLLIGNKSKSLGINVNGNVLVYFKISGDQHCNAFEPVFVKLAANEKRTMLAILDIQQNQQVYKMAKESSTPLTAVPLLILYVNGRPHAKFNGTKNVTSLQGFITKALKATIAPPKATPSTFMPSQNMYGGGGMQYQQQGHQKGWNPEIGKPPSLKGVIKGGYAQGNNVEEEDDQKLMIPDTVTPHNTPWEAEFQEPN